MRYYTRDGELYHYGVPGMKWGVRKAKPIAGVSNAYRSREQKKYDRRLSRAVARGANSKRISRLQRKLDVVRERDAAREAYSRRTSTGKKIAQTMLLGVTGAQQYRRLRAANYSRAKAYIYTKIINDRGRSLAAENAMVRIRENREAKKRLKARSSK